MKKILLILGVVLMSVSCNKFVECDVFVLMTPKNATFNKQEGGTITVEADDKAYVRQINRGIKTSNEYEPYQWEVKSFFKTTPPRYEITLEDINKYKEYEAFGCKVIPDASKRKFTIVVEPNCDSDAITVVFSRIAGNYGSSVPTEFEIRLE
jgi:TusA-related sulfurtransferase